MPSSVKYIYISTDSTYNASGLLIEQCGEKGMDDQELYKIYDQYVDGIPEKCA